jgi:hypothetical protein
MHLEYVSKLESCADFAGYVRESLGASGMTQIVEDQLNTLQHLAAVVDVLTAAAEIDADEITRTLHRYDDISRKVSARIENVSSGSPIADAMAFAMGQINSC